MLDTIRTCLATFRTKQEGATAVEYGIMIALIAAVIIGVVFVIGEQTEEGFQIVSDELGSVDSISEGTS